MRALCGAIIAAGALLGLGLTALGMGERYAGYQVRNAEGKPEYILFSQMDSPLIFITLLLSLVLLIGLGIAFFGLAFHHHRRWCEEQTFLAEHEEKKPARSRSK